MAETQTETTPPEAPAPAAPTTPAAPGAETVPTPRAVPNRKKRYSFFEDGLDYVLLSVQQDAKGKAVPNGALNPIPEVPRFSSGAEAKRWVQSSGVKLAGLTVIVARLMNKLQVLAEQRAVISVHEETKFAKEPSEE